MATLIIGLVILCAVALAVRSSLRRKKKGGGCAGCSGCSGCPGQSQCSGKKSGIPS